MRRMSDCGGRRRDTPPRHCEHQTEGVANRLPPPEKEKNMNEFDDYAGEWDDVDIAACDDILGPAEDVDSDDFWDCDEEE